MPTPELTADVRELLDQLDQAHAAATPGPWQYDPSEGDAVWDADEQRPSIIALTRDPYGHCEADAALIVAAVNHLPRLTAALRAVAEVTVQLDWRAVEFDEISDDLDDCAVNRAAARTAQEAADSIRAALTAALDDEAAS